MKIFWQPTAIAQRENVTEFIAEDSIADALGFDEEVDAKCDRLMEFPLSGRPGRVPGTRGLLVHPNYLAVYRIANDTVEIIAFLHAAQRWP